jgi:hypothetical protein
MLCEVNDLDVPHIIDDVAENEARVVELREQIIHVHVIVRQRLVLDAFRAIIESPLPVGDTPQTGKEQSRQRRKFR